MKKIFLARFDDTHMEKLCFIQFNQSINSVQEWLFFMCLHNQLSPIHSIITYKDYRCLKIVIHQIDSKQEWLLLSASFTAKFWVGFSLNTGKRFFLEVSF